MDRATDAKRYIEKMCGRLKAKHWNEREIQTALTYLQNNIPIKTVMVFNITDKLFSDNGMNTSKHDVGNEALVARALGLTPISGHGRQLPPLRDDEDDDCDDGYDYDGDED